MNATTFRASAITASLMLAASAQAQFSVQHLGTFGPAVCFKMNNAGQIAGDYQFMSLTTPMRYTPGVGIVARTTQPGSGLGYALGINNNGWCIGMVDMPGAESSQAIIWDNNNVMTVLPPVDTFYSYNTGMDINDSNVACGYTTQALVGDDVALAWRWDSVNGYTPLQNLTFGAYAQARDINASGAICGISANTESAPTRAVIWDASNVITAIPLLAGATSNYANAINDLGVVVGNSNGSIAPWRYTPGSGVVALAKYGNEPAAAFGVNDAGWVVGYARQFGEWHTVVWDPTGVLYRISDYVSALAFYFPADNTIPIAINNNNDLVVRAMDFSVSGDPRAVRFHFGYPAACPADVNDDNSVNVTDLLAVIAAWGPCADPNNCPADVAPTGGDDQVNVTDLLAVIGAWGACP